MRRIIAYVVDSLVIAILSGSIVLVCALAGIEMGIFQCDLILSVLYIGLFPFFRAGATPGLFIVGLEILRLNGTQATIYQLLLRASVLTLLFPAINFIMEFAFTYWFQLSIGNLVGWGAIAIYLTLASVPFLMTRCTMGFHDHFSGTCITPKRRCTRTPIRPMKRLSSLVVVCIGLAAVAVIGGKIYAPATMKVLQRTPLPEILAASEDLDRKFSIESRDLIEGLDEPFAYYADLHGFHGLVSWEAFSAELRRKGLLKYVQDHNEIPVYSVLLTARGQFNRRAQDEMAENVIRFLRPRGYNACTIDFVSRTDLFGLLTLRISHRVIAVDALQRRPEVKEQMVVLVDSPYSDVQLISSGLPEAFVQAEQRN
jgi:uncharacterized RDD family membrane protein YckC